MGLTYVKINPKSKDRHKWESLGMTTSKLSTSFLY